MKKILMIIVIVICGIVVATNITNKNKKLRSYLAMENVEALAQKEEAEGYI